MRRVFGVILVALLLIMTVSGCSSKDKKEIKVDNKLSKGRYVEENIVLPEGIAANELVAITVSPNGEIELYASHNDSYAKYLYMNKKWDMGKAVASMKSNAFNPNNFTVRKIFYGEDKKQYLYGDNVAENKSVLYRLSASGVFEKVEIKRFKDTNEEWDNIPYMPKVIKVLENGMIAAAYSWSVIEVYSPDGQSVIGEYNCGRSCMLAAKGNTLYYTDQNDKKILSINMETKKEGSPRSFNINLDETGILELYNGTAYICNSSGINLNVKGASLWETVLDGGQSSLSMPSERLKDFAITSEDEYFILVSNQYNNDISIKRVFYDKNINSVPPTELSIFSIEDNPTIRQAIIMFQESHPDVRINFRIANTDSSRRYTYGIKNSKQTITLKDQINALNTELLAGKGADILVMDGMPIESYIDKGILEDMGSVFSSMKASGKLLPSITDPYYIDGKVYTMPIRFKLPIITGVSDAVSSADSITELAEYARNNKKIPLFTPSNYRALAAWLFLTYYDQILGKDNEIDEAALKNFLEKINIISEAIHASDEVKLYAEGSSNGTVIWITFSYWTGDKVYEGKCQSIMGELGGMMDFALPLKVVQKRQGAFGTINHRFKAYGQIGINSAGNHKKLAKEFIQLLFSKEIQTLDLKDGFPVNKAAMEELVKHDILNYFSVPMGDATVTCYYPEKEDRKKIYERICAADKPMVNDMTMLDMILDEAEKYLRGDITAEQAARNAAASIHLYRSE